MTAASSVDTARTRPARRVRFGVEMKSWLGVLVIFAIHSTAPALAQPSCARLPKATTPITASLRIERGVNLLSIPVRPASTQSWLASDIASWTGASLILISAEKEGRGEFRPCFSGLAPSQSVQAGEPFLLVSPAARDITLSGQELSSEPTYKVVPHGLSMIAMPEVVNSASTTTDLIASLGVQVVVGSSRGAFRTHLAGVTRPEALRPREVFIVMNPGMGMLAAVPSPLVTGSVVLQTNAIIVSETAAAGFTAYSPDSGLLTVTSECFREVNAQVGSVLAVPPTRVLSTGLIVAITGVAATLGEVALNTRRAALTEVIRSGSFSINARMSPALSPKRKPDTRKTALPHNAAQVLSQDWSFPVDLADGNLSASGSLDFGLAVNMTVTIEPEGVKQFRTVLIVDRKERGSIRVAEKGTFSSAATIASVSMSPRVFFLPIPASPFPLPIVASGNVSIVAGASGAASAKLQWAHDMTRHYNYVITYDGSGWSTETRYTESSSVSNHRADVAGSVEAEVFVKPEIALTLYGSLSVFANARVSAAMRTDSELPGWSVIGRIRGGAGARIAAFPIIGFPGAELGEAKLFESESIMAQSVRVHGDLSERYTGQHFVDGVNAGQVEVRSGGALYDQVAMSLSEFVVPVARGQYEFTLEQPACNWTYRGFVGGDGDPPRFEIPTTEGLMECGGIVGQLTTNCPVTWSRVRVIAYRNGEYWDDVYTGSSGVYKFYAEPGTYTLRVVYGTLVVANVLPFDVTKGVIETLGNIDFNCE